MKYLHLFEKYNRKYWKIKTAMPIFGASINKIGMPEFEQQKFLNVYLEYISMFEYVYVGVDPNKWGWNDEEYVFVDPIEHKYMGEVNVTPTDIKKWDLKNNINRYNL